MCENLPTRERCTCGGETVRLGTDVVDFDDEGFGEAWIVYRCNECGKRFTLPETVLAPHQYR